MTRLLLLAALLAALFVLPVRADTCAEPPCCACEPSGAEPSLPPHSTAYLPYISH